MKSRLLFLFFFTASILSAQVTSVGIIGTATPGGWADETPLTQVDDSTWTIDIYLLDGEAKFRANNSWDVNWGDSTFPDGIGTQGGPNIPVFDGDYTINFNSNSGAYSFQVKSDIGIIGDATPKGWGEDTNMYRNPADTAQYFVILDLTIGEVKFRQGDDWDINWGAETFPDGVGVQGGPNIPVSAAGKYRIDFNKVTGEYSFSEVVEFTNISVIGSATPGDWVDDTQLTRDAANPALWKGTVTLMPGELKFRANNDWALSWGGGLFPSDTSIVNGDNIVVPDDAGGDYLVSFNTESLIYNFQIIGNYTTVSIIGDATPGGWVADTPLTQDADDKSIWRGRFDLLDGELKFRADEDWIVNWGGDGFPSGIGYQDGPNILVVAGDYKITFNSTTGEYNFEAVLEYDRVSLVGKSGPFNAWPDGDDSRDADLVKDSSDGNLWTLAEVTLTDFDAADTGGSGIKFRANADWTVNWGAVDFPLGVGTQGGPNIECVAGTYSVVFRSDTGEYTFTDVSSTYDVLSPEFLRIYPNPAVNTINISSNTDAFNGESTLKVFDLNGRLLKIQNIFFDNIVSLPIEDLKAGQYTITITNGKNIAARQFTVVK